MCNQIVQFCSNSTKPLLFTGSFLIFLLACAIGYTGCSTNSLFVDLDPLVAQSRSLFYYLQLLACLYLIVLTILTFIAAQYDNKHTIRALAFLTAINFVLATGGILFVPSGSEIVPMFEKRLQDAARLYDFTNKPEVVNKTLATKLKRQAETLSAVPSSGPTGNKPEDASAAATAAPSARKELDKVEATKLWDKLQARGCCGYQNATSEWSARIPKSCCSDPVLQEAELVCKKIDQYHNQACKCIIESNSLNLLIVLALIALVNLYLATITGVNAYRTCHYDEANQNAYR